MKRWFLLVLVISSLLAGCGGSGGELEVTDVWGRNSPMAAENGAFYMVITNNSGQDEQLLAASADVCTATELHEMYMMENDVMGMQPVPGGVIAIPNGETVELAVGGLHVMCLGKTTAFEIGDEIPITLSFANAGEMTVTAEILEDAPGG